MDEDGQLGELLRLVRAQAEETARMRAELASLRAAPATATTLRQLYERYEATWASATWAPQMRGNLAAGLRHYGDRVADSITRAEWVYWRDVLRAKETTLRKGPPSIYTRNQEFQRWRTAYRWGMAEGHVARNPLADVRAARGGKKHRETEPTAADLLALRPHCSPRLWAFVLLAFRRGFRASEARRLEWRQVDLEAGRIMLYAWQEKTRRAHRMRITSDVVEALRAIKPDVGRYVFPGRDGPLHATTLWREFRTACDTAALQAAEGDRRVTYHDWRHGFTSGAARKMPLQVAMRLSRHKSLSAAQRYIHVNESDLDAAHEVLEAEARKPPRKIETPLAEHPSRENTADVPTR